MNKKLPEFILVLGEKFAIEMVPDLKDKEGNRLSGETDGENRRVKIDSGLDSSRQWETMTHEVVHCVSYVTGITNVLDPSIEEIFAQSLEHALTQMWRVNGEIMTKVFKSSTR